MLFHSLPFLLIFLPAAIAAYYLFADSSRARIWILIIASVVFYGYWDLRLVPLLICSITLNWLLAAAFSRFPKLPLLTVGVALNLLILGIFKYADFFADNLAALAGAQHQPWSIALPLGISFFTFQQISYLIDLRRHGGPLYRFDEYALYVSFFPQLIAGPIVRHNEIIFQYKASPIRPGLDERLSKGLALFIIGLAKKAGIADHMAAIADPLFAAAGTEALSFGASWVAAAAFTFQIYFDFSGYSDMAIGLGLMFGLVLPVNFNAPYRAVSIRDFWRRWHMTLSRFLRDYLYIPLGGNRHGLAHQAGAVLITMLLGGLWHGAAWTFVAWGGLHGAALVINRLWEKTRIRLPVMLSWGATLLFVVLAWVLFRAGSFADASSILSSMAGGNGFILAVAGIKNLWLIPLAAVIALLGPTSQKVALDLLAPRRAIAIGLATALVLVLLDAGGGDSTEFIYFQF
jgi:D-alanyl-lipoteichoic acid acyltransferase DltB (MBOAT superfamily)